LGRIQREVPLIKENEKNGYPHEQVEQQEIADVAFGAHPLIRVDAKYSKQKALDRPKKRIEPAPLFVISLDHVSAHGADQEYLDDDNDYNRDDCRQVHFIPPILCTYPFGFDCYRPGTPVI
jgi:hypothetical protein